jgi:hypothetical protein
MTSLLTEKTGRIICWGLVLVDSVLGTSATFFPQLYCALLHPRQLAGDCATELIVRTGILWLMFMVFQLCAALSRNPQRWFFSVGLMRLMEVPADLAYGVLAQGTTLASRGLILSAPIGNSVLGMLLVAISRLSRTPRPPSPQEER